MREIVGDVVRYHDLVTKIKIAKFFILVCLLVICKNLCSRKFPVIGSTCQHKRLTGEDPEQRGLRLEFYSTRCKEQQPVQPQLPLFQQCSIQAKMQKFHVCEHGYLGYTNMLHLFRKILWPSIFTQSLMNVCIAAATSMFVTYTHPPANNTNPSPIPPHLQASNTSVS